MNRLPYTLYRAADVLNLEQIAIHEFGIPGIELMNRAGGAAFDELCSRWPEANHIVIVCGAGNNGGDGFVLARLASEKGYDVSVVPLTDPSELRGEARTAWGAAQSAGIKATAYDAQLLQEADVIVDAIFGTGLDRAVTGATAEVIQAINAAQVPVLSLDIPSGLHADSGQVLGAAIQADVTISFIGLKQGLFTTDGVDYSGAVIFNDLGVNKAVYGEVAPSCERFDWLNQRACLPVRPRNSHKGMFGHVLVIGGNHGMAGAVRLAADAVVRCGSGLASVATRVDHVAAMAAARPEVMWHGIENGVQLRSLMRQASVVAIGPGLGQDKWAREVLGVALESDLPLVVDADALKLLATEPVKRGNWILTPHPGEAGTMLGVETKEVNQQRFNAATRLAEQFNAVTVLKGAGTLVCCNSGSLSLCSEGNPGLASGGMGDVLTGIIAAFVAQGMSLDMAARAGVALHAAAADKVAVMGMRGMLAGDLIVALRGLVN